MERKKDVKDYSDVSSITLKGRVSRFGACASDNVSAVKPIFFGPIRSEYTDNTGGIRRASLITCWHKNKTDRPVFRSRFRKKQKGCPCKTHGDFCSAASCMSHDIP